jgi:hypothetical protein
MEADVISHIPKQINEREKYYIVTCGPFLGNEWENKLPWRD